jgi:hypothetical protein
MLCETSRRGHQLCVSESDECVDWLVAKLVSFANGVAAAGHIKYTHMHTQLSETISHRLSLSLSLSRRAFLSVLGIRPTRFISHKPFCVSS